MSAEIKKYHIMGEKFVLNLPDVESLLSHLTEEQLMSDDFMYNNIKITDNGFMPYTICHADMALVGLVRETYHQTIKKKKP